MTLAAAEASAAAVDRDQRNEHQVGLDDGMPSCRLHDAERPGLERIAGEKAERLGWIGETGIADDRADRARFLHCWQRADFRAKRAIAADHRHSGEQRRKVLG